MSDLAIRVEGLSKQYQIGGPQVQYKTIRESIVHGVSAPVRRVSKLVRGESYGAAELDEKIWALEDVSFEVQRGEVVGIIGRNGAGKTTMLKILSRITKPTEGRVTIHGRVGSLLEVGTGFHPELTGSENIYLNGAILGMRREEIERKLDEIVDFAEIEKFMDTPVKHFSSGMYLRLAFSVAAHLEPEILMVDEVLAVGDIDFQRKCLGKMGNVAESGRTILFVSHNMAAIAQMCSRSILLNEGRIQAIGSTDNVIRQYVGGLADRTPRIDLLERVDFIGKGDIRFAWASIRGGEDQRPGRFSIGEELVVKFGLDVKFPHKAVRTSVSVRTTDGLPVYHMVDSDSGFRLDSPSNDRTISVTLPQVRLYPGSYTISLWIGDVAGETLDKVEDCLVFDVIQGGKLVSRKLPRSHGLVFETPVWRVNGAS